MKVSIIIRVYNEQRHLAELLSAIESQQLDVPLETIVVDSGSTDNTLDIARAFGCRILRITKQEFTFGRSLNLGCDAAAGSILVFVSGHCVPCARDWLATLIEPIRSGVAVYSYGRQIGRDSTKFSEREVFSKYFPKTSKIPQDGFFCNNANAAVSKAAWEKYRFDETLTGLEDLRLAKTLVLDGQAVAYVAEAAVHHIHDETWHQVRTRYEREAIALREIMPEVHIGLTDFLRYFISGVIHDFKGALRQKIFLKHATDVIAFRWMQFWGTYRGNLEHRLLSAQQREAFFYPAPSKRRSRGSTVNRSATYESSQRAGSGQELSSPCWKAASKMDTGYSSRNRVHLQGRNQH